MIGGQCQFTLLDSMTKRCGAAAKAATKRSDCLNDCSYFAVWMDRICLKGIAETCYLIVMIKQSMR